MTNSGLPAAVLLDMDGTSIDSEPLWIESEVKLAESFGREFDPAQGANFVGTSLLSTAEWFANWIPTDTDPKILERRLLQYVVDHFEGDRILYRPGFFELLDLCDRLGIPVGIVTSSHRDFLDKMLAAVGPERFAVSLAGNEVENQKPDPEPYRTAAQILGVAIEDCVVVEDSNSGVASAVASGAHAVGIPCMTQVKPQPGLTVLESLHQLDEAKLRELVA
ncbi:hypothetical protein BSR29_04190 [Boudabousia liubingyangii]|uniref:HAD family phosphatase n=1 Tax=Boudabousia liubingyangii TaxID=1921764 RepID=A0A1Q5PNN4_9ACTO|nr:HAD family phosphatase [Boudabousia liubingyangii]OKL47616.1 hypothetical protein BSR28_03760 [Boudabousia liubingyangii]OKL49040.1 hypothetical protein BSR29_04190 [Boudabousia liubingyangii]